MIGKTKQTNKNKAKVHGAILRVFGNQMDSTGMWIPGFTSPMFKKKHIPCRIYKSTKIVDGRRLNRRDKIAFIKFTTLSNTKIHAPRKFGTGERHADLITKCSFLCTPLDKHALRFWVQVISPIKKSLFF